MLQPISIIAGSIELEPFFFTYTSDNDKRYAISKGADDRN